MLDKAEYSAFKSTLNSSIASYRINIFIDFDSVSRKIPLRFSDIFHFFPNGREFLVNFYTPITRSHLRQITNFYSIISNFDEVMPY